MDRRSKKFLPGLELGSSLSREEESRTGTGGLRPMLQRATLTEKASISTCEADVFARAVATRGKISFAGSLKGPRVPAARSAELLASQEGFLNRSETCGLSSLPCNVPF